MKIIPFLTTLYANILGGRIENTIIGGNTPAAGNFTDVTATTLTASLPLFTDANKKLISKSIPDTLTALGLTDAITYKGAIDCSGNPNYPAANVGDYYKVSVAGLIGGSGGVVVQIGDALICNTDGSVSGNQAAVGVNWNVLQTNIDLANPGPIGGNTPAPGNFTTLTYNSLIDLRGGLIGTPGAAGFGVGVCPIANLPAGMTPLAGYNVLGDSNYGNYQFSDGSIMVFVPKFFYRIAHASNPTYAVYGVNSIDIKGIDTFIDTAAANAAGYALHRAFIDGGVEQVGFFVDKYKCSKNALGTGFVASSIQNGLPLSSAAAHNPFSGCTGGADVYYSALDLAHRRDGLNGNVNAASIFFCASQFVRAALAMLSLAHGQASTSTAHCAWYHATYNFPKGCNNNALSDYNDAYNSSTNPTGPLYVTDGYDTGSGVYTCGKTGSASPYAKTTHNGQTCGIADLNGLMYEISIGLTCIATSPAIEAMSSTNPCEITVTAHGKATGDPVQINGITQADWSGCTGKIWTATKTGDNTFTILFDASAFGTAYDAVADPGTVTLGNFYAAKQATRMKNFTQDNSTATGHWGATGVAAMMDKFTPAFSGAFYKLFGSGSNQVLSEALSGANRLLTGLGMPKDASGFGDSGTNLFGQDMYYQNITNEMCLIACAYWSNTSYAGVWYAYWGDSRSNSNNSVGFRAACYPV